MSDDRNAPATKGDIADLRGEIGDLRGEIGGMRGEMRELEDRLLEAIDDKETKLLSAFYAFADTNQKRLTEAERESAAIKDRLASLETRVTEVEKRLNMPPRES